MTRSTSLHRKKATKKLTLDHLKVSKKKWENYEITTNVKITFKWKDYERIRQGLIAIERMGAKLDEPNKEVRLVA